MTKKHIFQQHIKKIGKLYSKWQHKLFKRRSPYAPIAYVGRKNVEKILGAKIKKMT